MKLSVIIVNYNVTLLLKKCLHSIKEKFQGFGYEVLVIDNASTDATWKDLIQIFPEVQFLENPSNDGFAVANNKAVAKAKGEYILLLNPDSEIESPTFNKVLEFADSVPNFGCLGVRMHNAEGQFLPESKRSIPNILNAFDKLFFRFKGQNSKSYYRNDIGEFEIAPTEVVTGAFLLAKRANYHKIGGLDEAYFMYGEDIDLCYSFLQHGFQNYYYGAFSILHYKGESTKKDKIYYERFYGAMKIFVNKYYGKKPLQRLVLLTGLKLKYLLESTKK